MFILLTANCLTLTKLKERVRDIQSNSLNEIFNSNHAELRVLLLSSYCKLCLFFDLFNMNVSLSTVCLRYISCYICEKAAKLFCSEGN